MSECSPAAKVCKDWKFLLLIISLNSLNFEFQNLFCILFFFFKLDSFGGDVDLRHFEECEMGAGKMAQLTKYLPCLDWV